MPRIRNNVARFVCAAVSAVVLCGGVSSLHDRHGGIAAGFFLVGALLAAVV